MKIRYDLDYIITPRGIDVLYGNVYDAINANGFAQGPKSEKAENALYSIA